MPQSEKAKITLFVGLGNPGNDYEKTRHNAGVWLVEAFLKHHRSQAKQESKFNAKVARLTVSGQEIKVVIPNTYMNHSGQAVGSIAEYYQIPVQNILIAHDELDLPPGTLRFKTDGGHGGHNGLRDIIHHLKSREFHRLRIGIGHPGSKDQVEDYVLTPPSRNDAEKIKMGIEKVLGLLPQFFLGDWQNAIHRLHSEEEKSKNA